MKNFFIVRPHSFIDVITNSSSELFIVKTGKTLETIKGILQSLIDTYNQTVDKDTYGHKTFDDTFGDIFIISKNTDKKLIDDLISTLADYGGNHDRPELGLKLSTYPKYDDYRIRSDIGETHDEAVETWIKIHRANFLKVCDGMIIIYSESDNSVPSSIMDFIEDSLNATRWHLG